LSYALLGYAAALATIDWLTAALDTL
jgi:hypothetical protein